MEARPPAAARSCPYTGQLGSRSPDLQPVSPAERYVTRSRSRETVASDVPVRLTQPPAAGGTGSPAARALHMHTHSHRCSRDILKPTVARSRHFLATTPRVRCPMHNAVTSAFASGEAADLRQIQCLSEHALRGCTTHVSKAKTESRRCAWPRGWGTTMPSRPGQSCSRPRPGRSTFRPFPNPVDEHRLGMSSGDEDVLGKRALKLPCHDLSGRPTSDDTLRACSAPGARGAIGFRRPSALPAAGPTDRLALNYCTGGSRKIGVTPPR
jgi:hypothetical protein